MRDLDKKPLPPNVGRHVNWNLDATALDFFQVYSFNNPSKTRDTIRQGVENFLGRILDANKRSYAISFEATSKFNVLKNGNYVPTYRSKKSNTISYTTMGDGMFRQELFRNLEQFLLDISENIDNVNSGATFDSVKDFNINIFENTVLRSRIRGIF